MQKASGPAARVVTPDRGVARVQFSEFQTIVMRFSVGDRFFDCPQLSIAVQNELDCRCFRRQQLLRDMRNRKVRRHLEASRVGLQLTADQ